MAEHASDSLRSLGGAKASSDAEADRDELVGLLQYDAPAVDAQAETVAATLDFLDSAAASTQ